MGCPSVRGVPLLVGSCAMPVQVVASMDWPGMSQYHARVSAQASRLEMIRDLHTFNPAIEGPAAHGGMIK